MFTFRLIATADDVPSDHDATEWEIYDFKPEIDKVDEAEPVYFSGTLTSDLLQHDALLPYTHFDLNWGMNNHWTRVRFRSASEGWGHWSLLKFMGFNKPIHPVRAFDRGPIEKNDNSRGLHKFNWMIELREDGLYLARENTKKSNWRTPEFLFTPDGEYKRMIYLDLTFDQNGRPTVCYEVMGIDGNPIHSDSWLYWYDSSVDEFKLTKYSGVRCPRVSRDWTPTNLELSGVTDVMFFYIDDAADEVLYRRQRDRYETAYSTGITSVNDKYLKLLGTTMQNRFAAVFIEKSSGWRESSPCWNNRVWVSSPFPIESLVDEFIYSNSLIEGSIFNAKRNQNEVLVYSSELIDGLLEQVFYYYDFYSPYEYLEYSEPKLLSGMMEQIFYYYDRYFSYEYLTYKEPTLNGGQMYQVFWSVNAYSHYEYLTYKKPELIGGQMYVP